jgi:hypothetical protein
MDNLTILSDKELINRYGTLTPLEKELLRRYDNMKQKYWELEQELLMVRLEDHLANG